MNILNILGGGLLIMCINYFAAILLFRWFWMPPGARPLLYLFAGFSGFSAGGCGLALLTGAEPLMLDTGQWGALFVAAQVFGLLAFNSALAVEVWRNRS